MEKTPKTNEILV